MKRTGLAACVALLVIGGVIAVTVAPARQTAQAATVQRRVERTVSRATLHYEVAPKGNSARYFVREQLAGVSFPSNAVGLTNGVTGGIVLDDNGRVVPGESKFVVDVTKLKSDRDMRDGYIQRRTLETATYPTVTLVPKEISGLTLPLPDSGRASFTVLGDLTVHGVTRPTMWAVTAFFRGGEIRGTASTGFTFADFQLQKPKVGSVLSVTDSIHLAYDFALVRAAGN